MPCDRQRFGELRILALRSDREPGEPERPVRLDMLALEIDESEVVLRLLHRPSCRDLPLRNRRGDAPARVEFATLLVVVHVGQESRFVFAQVGAGSTERRLCGRTREESGQQQEADCAEHGAPERSMIGRMVALAMVSVNLRALLCERMQ
ncbi:MAG: hypothetical protein EOP90_07385 [Lysobacteraceae bacterium]|nr:MAG: hypothetical protein EOP90_07385 [Xanthomonadaceae bacterium]